MKAFDLLKVNLSGRCRMRFWKWPAWLWCGAPPDRDRLTLTAPDHDYGKRIGPMATII